MSVLSGCSNSRALRVSKQKGRSGASRQTHLVVHLYSAISLNLIQIDEMC